MTGIQYQRNVIWDVTLVDLSLDEANLVIGGEKTTSGAPTATAGHFRPSAMIQNIADGKIYVNTGTTAAPVFSAIDTGTSFSLPTTATDSTTTTTTSFQLTTSAITTGIAQNIIAAAVTTGSVYKATLGTSLTTGGAFNASLGAAVTGYALSSTTTGVYTGAGLIQITANSATTGTLGFISGTGLTTGSAWVLIGGGANMTSAGQVQLITMGAATTGQGLQITSTGVYTGLNGIFQATANSATTGTIARINGTGLTSGNGLYVVGGGANMLTGGNVGNFDMGAGIAGSAILAQTSGVYTGTDGVSRVTANSATTGIIDVISATGLTSGIAHRTIAAAATLTTGRYYSAFDGALEVFGIGANGHIHSTQTTAPTAATNATGISAVAITAGSTDTCGTITTTGTPASGTVLTITFNKTYTTAPKFVTVEAANAAGGGVNTPPIITQTATTFVLTWPAGGVYAATPSFTYLVVA